MIKARMGEVLHDDIFLNGDKLTGCIRCDSGYNGNLLISFSVESYKRFFQQATLPDWPSKPVSAGGIRINLLKSTQQYELKANGKAIMVFVHIDPSQRDDLDPITVSNGVLHTLELGYYGEAVRLRKENVRLMEELKAVKEELKAVKEELRIEKVRTRKKLQALQTGMERKFGLRRNARRTCRRR